MRNVSRKYPVFGIDLMYLEPNEQYLASVEVSKACIAGFILQGNSVYSSVLDVSDSVWLPDVGGYFELSAEERLHPVLCTAGDNGFSWLCVSFNVEGQYETGHVNVAGDYTLPAGWGFVVAKGEVTAEGKTATQGLYFGPRATDVVVSGNADLIIVR